VTDGACGACFVEEAPDQLLVQGEHRPKHLDGRAPLDVTVFRKVDLAKGALPDRAHDVVVAEEPP